MNFDFLEGYKTKISTFLLALFTGSWLVDWSISTESVELFVKTATQQFEVIFWAVWVIYGLFMKWVRNEFKVKLKPKRQDKFQIYIDKMLWNFIDYDNVYWMQCVDLIKHYTRDVLNIRLGTFWGSAKTWWENRSSTFPDSEWRKIENDFSNPSQVPSRGDVIFFEGSSFHPLYWHVAIVVNAVSGENKIQVLEQNGVWSGTGIWKDSIRLEEYTYNGVSGWYSKK